MSDTQRTVPDTIQWKRDYLAVIHAIESLQAKRELQEIPECRKAVNINE